MEVSKYSVDVVLFNPGDHPTETPLCSGQAQNYKVRFFCDKTHFRFYLLLYQTFYILYDLILIFFYYMWHFLKKNYFCSPLSLEKS